MKDNSLDNISVPILESINTNYDEIAKYCNFKTELMQPSGSVIPPYEGILPNNKSNSIYEPVSEKESEEIYQSFIDEL